MDAITCTLSQLRVIEERKQGSNKLLIGYQVDVNPGNIFAYNIEAQAGDIRMS